MGAERAKVVDIQEFRERKLEKERYIKRSEELLRTENKRASNTLSIRVLLIALLSLLITLGLSVSISTLSYTNNTQQVQDATVSN